MKKALKTFPAEYELMGGVLGRPLVIESETVVRENKVTRPNLNKSYVYGRVDLSLPPEYIGRRVRIIALVFEETTSSS